MNITAEQAPEKHNDAHVLDMVRLIEKHAHESGYKYRPWLPKNATAAFMCCIGAGPWKFTRRKKIQGQAMRFLAAHGFPDLSAIDTDHFLSYDNGHPLFPLDWQNSFTIHMHAELAETNQSFDEFCARLSKMSYREAAQTLRKACAAKSAPKVLDMFVRDYLERPSFPIDRHVERELQERHLPVDQDVMTDLCLQAGVDTLLCARYLGSKNLDGGNPDWTSIKIQPSAVVNEPYALSTLIAAARGRNVSKSFDRSND